MTKRLPVGTVLYKVKKDIGCDCYECSGGWLHDMRVELATVTVAGYKGNSLEVKSAYGVLPHTLYGQSEWSTAEKEAWLRAKESILLEKQDAIKEFDRILAAIESVLNDRP